ncbi:unnamed protein product [Prorocentrum cordatum]|uniref:Uncharacterized protein n=1 Tax=Prorocentrum cordatum TaxID=2364126 RepID=A0ABN9V960_9DINO|nr:unnamed protein product [Polarella glacialis]
MVVRWKSFVPLAWCAVVGYAAAAYLIGGPDMRLAPLNLMLLAFLATATCRWKRSSELQTRLLHLSHLREKGLRFSAEFSAQRLQDRQAGRGVSRWGPFVGACRRRRLRSWPRGGGGSGLAALRSDAPLSAPAWLDSAAAGCAAGACPARREAGGGADAEAAPGGMDCLPLDAGLWVEGRSEPCAIKDRTSSRASACCATTRWGGP